MPQIMKTNPFIGKENASESQIDIKNLPNVSYSQANLT